MILLGCFAYHFYAIDFSEAGGTAGGTLGEPCWGIAIHLHMYMFIRQHSLFRSPALPSELPASSALVIVGLAGKLLKKMLNSVRDTYLTLTSLYLTLFSLRGRCHTKAPLSET